MNTSCPFASELQGALADGFADRPVGRAGGEPIGLGVCPGHAGSESDSVPRAPQERSHGRWMSSSFGFLFSDDQD